MNVLISINCITYNHEYYIADAIESFLKQKTNFPYEILIGEDCSTDGTKEIVKEYVEKYPGKIRLVTSEQNVGGRKNSVRLQKKSKGKYIAICEGDDYWIDPYKLQKQVDYMEGNPECTLCFHNAFVVKAKKKVGDGFTKTLIKDNNKLREKDNNYSAGELALLGFIPTASLLYPKHIMDTPPEWYFTAIVGDNSLKLITTSYGYAHYLDQSMSVYRVEVKGSIMDKWRKESGNKEKQIFVTKGFIKLFNDFDKFSGELHNVKINKAKIPFELQLLRLERKKEKLKQVKYGEYLRELDFRERLKYYLGFYLPSIYSILARIKAYR